jgi:molybdate transport repressor ModE-like protein
MRVLREIARHGSFSAAARALSYTQSAVSQHVAALERETGARLVERTGRGVRLTQAGEVIVRHADAVLARLAEAEAELEALAGLRGGRLRLACFPTAGATIMPQAVATFRARHPGVELSLADAEPFESVPRLRAGELDLALVFEPNGITDDHDAGVQRQHLLDDPFFLALPAGHPAAGRGRVRLADLAGEPWINTPAWCHCSVIVLRACAAAGFEPHVAFESDDYLAVQGLVAAGLGVALIPELALATVREDIVIRPLGHAAPVRRIVAATSEGVYSSPATAAMLDVLAEVAGRIGAERPALPLAVA